MKFYCTDKDQVLQELGAQREGWTSAEAQKRLEQNGKNKLAAPPGKTLFQRFLEQLADPMIIILLAAAAISGVLAVVEGESFADRAFLLEDDLASTYCYPAITQVKDGFLVAYYHSNGGTYTLASTKISKVYFSEIEG